jgi:phytoene synthase
MALNAFNAEIARIPDLVSEPALGEIRLQWWRDALETLEEGGTTGNPIADVLGHAKRSRDIPTPLLLGIIDARSADLDGRGFADMSAMKAYLNKTQGAVFETSARMLGASSAGLGKTANAAGVAYGLARRLQSLPHDAVSGRVMVPLSVLQRHGLLPEELLAGQDSAALNEMTGELMEEARAALAKARAGIEGRGKHVRTAFAPLALVEPALRLLQKPRVRPLHDVVDINPLARFVRLWRAARFGRI